MNCRPPAAARRAKLRTRVRVCTSALGMTLVGLSSAETPPNNQLHPPQRPVQNNVVQGNRLAMVNTNQSHLVQSQNFLGRPGPPGSTEIQTHNGNIVRRAADGQVIDVRNPRSGMVIHHGLNGARHVSVVGADHSRVFATTRGLSYVQHPYQVNGRTYDNRTFAVQGQVFHMVYRPYTWGGQTLDSYAPTRFYAPQFYRMAVTRMPKPFTWQWTYLANPPPWYGYYRGYFVPESSYSTPTMWLTDFLLASSLALAYRVEPPGSATAPSAPSSGAAPAAAPSAAAAAPPGDGTAPTITPQVKEMLAKEVGHQVAQEAEEAQANSQNRDVQPGAGSIVQELGDRQDHVFVANSDLDLVDQNGRRCMISEGDVVNVQAGIDQASSTAMAVILASKGAGECERAAQVPIPISELQEMQNHMRATIDQGLASTPAGKKAQTVTPAFASSAPPADSNAANEIDTQQKIAAAEG